jgi:hypothetical protein
MVLSTICLIFMICYLTFIRNKKAGVKPAVKTVAAAQAQAGKTDCPEYKKALIKTARMIKDGAVWDNTAVPYVVTGNIIVGPAATFTVKPGVVIKFQGKNTSLIVKGKIVAKGTKAKPICFTSFNDDAEDGDTNCDGGAVKPAAGDYGTIDLGTKKSIANCEFKYATVVK